MSISMMNHCNWFRNYGHISGYHMFKWDEATISWFCLYEQVLGSAIHWGLHARSRKTFYNCAFRSHGPAAAWMETHYKLLIYYIYIERGCIPYHILNSCKPAPWLRQLISHWFQFLYVAKLLSLFQGAGYIVHIIF